MSAPASHAKFGNPACCSRLTPAGTRTPTLSNSGQVEPQGRGGLRDLRQAGHLANPGGRSIRKRFCSQACMLKWRGPVLSDLRREDHKRREHVCKWCGETFRRLDSQTKDGRGQFCSRQRPRRLHRQVQAAGGVASWSRGSQRPCPPPSMVFETQARAGRFVLDVLFPRRTRGSRVRRRLLALAALRSPPRTCAKTPSWSAPATRSSMCARWTSWLVSGLHGARRLRRNHKRVDRAAP